MYGTVMLIQVCREKLRIRPINSIVYFIISFPFTPTPMTLGKGELLQEDKD